MKKLLGIMLVLALMGTFGCGGQADTEVMEDIVMDENAETSLVTGDTVASQEDIDLLREITSDPNSTSEDCEGLQDESLRGECERDMIYREAVNTQNPEKCQELGDKDDIDACINDIPR